MDGLEMLEMLKAVDVEAIAEQTVEDNTEVIADLMATQLSQGLNSAGDLIGDFKSYKNAKYAEYKNELNPVPGLGNPDLRSTEAFYRGLYAAVQGVNIEFGSADDKADSLQKKYSSTPVRGSIFGLTEDSRDELVTGYLERSWERRIFLATGLGFT